MTVISSNLQWNVLIITTLRGRFWRYFTAERTTYYRYVGILECTQLNETKPTGVVTASFSLRTLANALQPQFGIGEE